MNQLDEDVKNVLKHYHLQDLICYIENLTYREEKQRQKIYNTIRERLIEALEKYIDLKYLNIEEMCQKFCQLFIGNYGLFFEDFITRHGEEIKRQYAEYIDVYDDYDLTDGNKVDALIQDGYIELACQGNFSSPIYSMVDARNVFGSLLGNHKIDDVNDILDIFGLLMDMGQEEGYYKKLQNQDISEAFCNYLYKYINS
jgi:hypothetical protein